MLTLSALLLFLFLDSCVSSFDNEKKLAMCGDFCNSQLCDPICFNCTYAMKVAELAEDCGGLPLSNSRNHNKCSGIDNSLLVGQAGCIAFEVLRASWNTSDSMALLWVVNFAEDLTDQQGYDTMTTFCSDACDTTCSDYCPKCVRIATSVLQKRERLEEIPIPVKYAWCIAHCKIRRAMEAEFGWEFSRN